MGSTINYQFIQNTAQQVDAELAAYMATYRARCKRPNEPAELATLWEALNYAVLNGGKRIRPVLLIHSCLACGGMLKDALPAACGIELVHAQSLIHDDLPCMDDDDLRRGKPTVHKAFGEYTAVLAGDALMAMSFGLFSRPDNWPANVQLQLVHEFSSVASMEGLVNGQYVDIVYEALPSTEHAVEYIHTHKTAAMFRFAARAGALIANAPAETVTAFTNAGHALGMAFQIIDDILDIEASTETLGKTVGKDTEQNKTTYPAVFGLEASRDKATEYLNTAIAEFKAAPQTNASHLQRVLDIGHYLIKRVY